MSQWRFDCDSSAQGGRSIIEVKDSGGLGNRLKTVGAGEIVVSEQQRKCHVTSNISWEGERSG